jgi:hypothetical protein
LFDLKKRAVNIYFTAPFLVVRFYNIIPVSNHLNVLVVLLENDFQKER